MAGIKGMKGGGGARPGAGRPKSPPTVMAVTPTTDPQVFLVAVMGDDQADMKLRLDAARALMPYVHRRLDDVGKKEERKAAAGKLGSRFAPSAPPRLVSSK